MYDIGCPPPPSLPVLLKLALDDLERVIAAGDPYTIYCSVWHCGQSKNAYRPARCEVCLAGAVMAMTLKTPPATSAEPGDFCPAWRRALEAIDSLRCGDVDIASELADPIKYPPKIAELINQNPEMSNYPGEWIPEWRDVQLALELARARAEKKNG